MSERRIAVFSPGVGHAQEITTRCQAQGIPAVTIVGSTPIEERQQAYAAVARGDIRVLSSCMVISEGFDLPSIDAIVLARATKSKVLYPQIVGRGLRLSPETGKTHCLLLDATGVTELQALFSLAELLGLAPERLHTGESVLEAVAKAPPEAEDVPNTAVHTKAVNLLERGTVHWVETPRGAFVCAMAGTTVRICPLGTESELYRVEMRHFKDGWRDYHLLAERLAKPYAFGLAGDTLRGAAWRKKPGSDRQCATCEKLGIRWNPTWTQGEASDAILRVTGDFRW